MRPDRAEPVLEAVGLTVGYRTGRRRRVVVLDGIDAALGSGQLVCLLGPNGTGKSTLLRTLVGSQPPLAGGVRVAGADLASMHPAERARRLSVVLTDRVDVGLLSVRALVALGRSPRLGWFSSPGDDDHRVVGWALAAAGAAELADRQVAELSDGERQRVMIARALAQEPSILVLDEPTAYLDLTRRVELMALLRRLVSETGLGVLLSTHDLDLALRCADALWLVHPGGRFQVGAPEALAADGGLADAYAGAGIRFDHGAGTFVVHDGAPGPAVEVTGAEPAATWARRAAVRAGWRPCPGADRTLTVSGPTGADGPGTGPAWALRGPEAPEHHGVGFDDLVDALRHHRQP